MAPRVTKRRMSVGEAASQWEAGKREIRRQQALVEEAGATLLDHFERTGNATYKGRIAWRWTGGSVVLDQSRVREFLGERLGEFQTTTKRSRSLVLLDSDA